MSGDSAVVSVVALVGGLAMVATLVREFFKYRYRQRPSPASDARLEQLAQQIAVLQQSVDVTSVEVERLGEGLRFTTKLLTERNHVPEPQRQPERVVTPH